MRGITKVDELGDAGGRQLTGFQQAFELSLLLVTPLSKVLMWHCAVHACLEVVEPATSCAKVKVKLKTYVQAAGLYHSLPASMHGWLNQRWRMGKQLVTLPSIVQYRQDEDQHLELWWLGGSSLFHWFGPAWASHLIRWIISMCP